ncbi:MAG: MFS transporter [Reinekea sp.]
MRIFLIILSTILAYIVLYAPQPLLPLFAENFAISESRAALLTTATMLPLSIAPLTYGYLLGYISATVLLRIAILGMAFTAAGFAFAESFEMMVSIRFLQGLLLPAALTSLMTYISATTRKEEMARTMAIYVTSTIFGGFLGRLLAGVSATLYHWQAFFVVLSVALLVCYFVLKPLSTEELKVQPEIPRIRDIVMAFKSHNNARVYLAVFCLFFVFAAILNFVPFRLRELRGAPSELLTGLLYSGYLMGAVASLGAKRIIRFLNGEHNAIITGFSCYTLGVLVTLFANEWGLFFALFAICGSMFFIHTIAATVVNQRAEKRGIVNGLYVTFYYGGGVLGSFAPGMIYERFGWEPFIMVLILVSLTGLSVSLMNKYHEKKSLRLTTES